jgi:signal transduction histidine kinase
LLIAALVANSVYFKKDTAYTIFGTLAAISAIIVSRQLPTLLFLWLGNGELAWQPIISRACSAGVLLAGIPLFKWLKTKLNDGLLPIRLLIANTTALLIALLIFLDFDATRTADNILIIAATVAALLIINLLVGVYVQKHSAERKRINMLEQYIPVIEELITQVRARQHEFDNKLLAISAAAQTAADLEQAQSEIAELTQTEPLRISENSLLNCDSKITAGVIYSKIRNAELKRIAVVSEIAAALKSGKNRTVRETDIVEIVGILMDNAIEASDKGDKIYIRITAFEEEGKLSILVSNPHEPYSATDFVKLFRRGVTTKSADNNSRGHGLANVKDIVERYRCKIITRNEMIDEQNYVTIGVVLP